MQFQYPLIQRGDVRVPKLELLGERCWGGDRCRASRGTQGLVFHQAEGRGAAPNARTKVDKAAVAASNDKLHQEADVARTRVVVLDQ